LSSTVSGVEAFVESLGERRASKAGADPARVGQALMGGFAASRILEVHGERMRNAISSPASTSCRQPIGRGSLGGDYISRKREFDASLAVCDRKFESVTPTSRTPFGGGNTDRIRSRAT
jgi:hypothetical protein